MAASAKLKKKEDDVPLAMAETAKAKKLKLELQDKKERLGKVQDGGTMAVKKKESPKKPFAEVDRDSYLLSYRMAVAAEVNSPIKVSNADKENNSPLSNRSARKKKTLLSILEEEETSLAPVCVSTDSGWSASSTLPLKEDDVKSLQCGGSGGGHNGFVGIS